MRIACAAGRGAPAETKGCVVEEPIRLLIWVIVIFVIVILAFRLLGVAL